MQLHMRDIAFRQGKRTKVADDERVGARGVRASRYGGKAAISAWLISVFTVTYTFTPAACAKATADGISSSVKFSARWRIPNLSAAKYTASAPETNGGLQLAAAARRRKKPGC